MAMQEVNDLLRNTVARVTELYETRQTIPTGFGDLPPFAGDTNDSNWSEWERKFSRLAILTGATTLNRKTALLANYLRGAALNYFGELEARQPPLADLNAWTAAYLTKFPNNRQIDVKYEQLIARTLSPGESVAVFAADVRRLAKRAFPTCNGAGEPNKIVENHFTNHLIPNICRWMKNAEPESFEAVTEAEKEEFREKQYHGENNLSFQVLANSANQLMNLVQQISAVNLAGNSNAKRRNELRTSQHDNFNQFPRQDDRFWPRNNARDLFAQLFGPQEPNWMGSCPNRAHNNYNCGRPSGRCSDGTVSCFRCGRMGHYSSTCPMLEREENSRFSSSTRSSWRSGPSRVQMPARGVSNPRSPGDALSGTRGVNSQLLVVPEANGPNVSDFNSDTIAEQLDPWNCDDYDLPIENSSARPQAHICMARYNEDFCFETGPNSALVSGGTGSIEIGDNPTTASHRFTGNNFEDPDDFGYSASVRSFKENCGATEFDYNEERQRCRQHFWGTNGIPGQVESASVFTDTAQTGGYNSNRPSESRPVGVVFCLNGPVAAARVCNLCDISNCKHMQDFESQSRQREIARQGPLEFTTERWINESIPWILWRPEVTSMEHLMQSQSIPTDSRIDRGRPENLHFRYRAEAVCRNWKLNRRRSPHFDFQQIWRSLVSSMTSYFWFNILLALSFLFGYAVGELFYQCEASRGGRTSMESKTMRCNSPPLIAVEKQEFKVHIQSTNRHLNQISAVRCVLRNRTVCMNTLIFGSKGIVSDTTSQNIVTPCLCRQVWIDKDYREQRLVEIQPGVWTTNQTLQVEFKWCCKDTCRSVQNLLLELGTIAAVDHKSTISDLGDTGGCPPVAGQCLNAGGTFIWNATTFEDYCPLALVGNFTGHVLQNHVIVEEVQGAFQLLVSISTCHLQNAYSTEQGPVLQFEEDIHQLLTNQGSSGLKFESMEKDPLNPKLQFLYDKVIEQESRLFQTIWTELCQSARQRLGMIWQLLKIDPTIGARALLMRNDIIASFAGQALMIWECEKVKPELIYWNHQVNQTCYAYLPIQIKNHILFVVPGTRDVIRTSPIVDCNHHIIGIYHEHGTGWRTSTGPVQVATLPYGIQWQGKFDLQTFNTPSYFQDQQSGIIHTFGLMRSYVSKISIIESTLNRLTRYTAGLSLDPTVVYETLAGTGKMIAEVTEGAANSLEHISTTGVKNLITTTDYLVSGPLQLILNLLIVLIIVIVLCIIMYFIFRRYLASQIGRCFHCSHRKSDQEPIIRFSDLQNHDKEEERREEVQDKPEDPVNIETAYSTMLKKAFSPWLSRRTLPKNETIGSNCNIGSRSLPTQDRCPTIDVWLNEDVENPVTTLVDSGSNIPLLGYDLAVKQGFPMLKPMIQSYKVVNSQTAEVVASCWIQISLTIPQKLSALPKFLRVNVVWKAAQIDFETIMASMKNPEIFLPDTTQGIVVLAETVTIPPRAIHFVDAQLEATYSQINALVFEPLTKFLARYHLEVASCLVRPNEGLIPVSVLNPTESPTTLHQGTEIGKVRVYQHLYSEELIACDAQYDHLAQISSTSHTQSAFGTQHPNFCKEVESTNLELEQRCHFFSLPKYFVALFALDEVNVGWINLAEHRIDNGDYALIHHVPNCVPCKQREHITEEITKVAEKGIVTPSQSPWARPIVLVQKKNGGFQLYTTTKKDNYPLHDIFDAVHGAIPFTTLDQAWGYWQILLAKDKEKTVFITYNRLYEFSVVPLGLCNTPATFQHLMNLVLSESQWSSCPVSRDDVSTRKTFDDNLIYLEEAFQQLQGQEIPAQGIKPDENKVNSFKNFTVPTNVDQLRSFPRLASYYRRFVQNFAKIAHPLHCLLKSAQKYEWTKVCQQVFVTLKERLNATNDRLGAVLSQNVEDREKPINTSRSLSQAERTCAIIEREASTVIRAVKYFHHYLYQQQVKVFTVHSALQSLFSKSHPSRRLPGWGLTLQEFREENIKHHARRINKNADALSRYPVNKSTETRNVKFDVNAITRSKKRKEKLENPNSTIAEVGFEKTSTIVQTSINKTRNAEAKVPKNAPTERIWSKFEEKSPTIDGTIDEEAQTIVSESIEIEKNASEIENICEERESDPFCRQLLTNLQYDHLPEDLKLAKKIVLLAPQFMVRNKILYYVDEMKENQLNLELPASRKEEICVGKHGLTCVSHATRKTTSKKNRTGKKHPTYTQRWTNSLNQPLEKIRLNMLKKNECAKEATTRRAMTLTDAGAETAVKMISAKELENFSTRSSEI